MPKIKEKFQLMTTHKSYNVGDWEGGIAVYGIKNEYGVVIAIPRLEVSTFLTGNGDSMSIRQMLEKNRTMRADDMKEWFIDTILSDFAR